ncbi:MAG: hypothetical protein H6858_01155 [Rhodospirillales bacterium]|nr:hypothetical protein [Alphaproteobacteria bacterium]MCB1839249.1 hypothetical protein [Alphaproteobacteria bacterium]MCB9976188.1 hypothetical protein [Rhodospirillales bacterium]
MGVGRSLQSFELELESISQIITHAFDTLREGKAPVLNDLSDRIDRLCRNVSAAEGEIARQLQPVMAGMIQRLDELALEIQRYQSSLKEA